MRFTSRSPLFLGLGPSGIFTESLVGFPLFSGEAWYAFSLLSLRFFFFKQAHGRITYKS
jgi:hypothetical protein